MKLFTDSKRTTASIKLPGRKKIGPSVNKKKKSANRKNTVTKRHLSAISIVLPRKQKKIAKEGAGLKTQFHIQPFERLVFVITLVLIVAFAAVFVSTSVRTRSARFEITEMKKEQLFLMKQHESLMKQISTYKRPELIEKRARQRGMVHPASDQIIVLP